MYDIICVLLINTIYIYSIHFKYQYRKDHLPLGIQNWAGTPSIRSIQQHPLLFKLLILKLNPCHMTCATQVTRSDQMNSMVLASNFQTRWADQMGFPRQLLCPRRRSEETSILPCPCRAPAVPLPCPCRAPCHTSYNITRSKELSL